MHGRVTPHLLVKHPVERFRVEEPVRAVERDVVEDVPNHELLHDPSELRQHTVKLWHAEPEEHGIEEVRNDRAGDHLADSRLERHLLHQLRLRDHVRLPLQLVGR